MPGGRRVHILGGRHDGLMTRSTLARNGFGLNTPQGLVPVGMHAAQFSKTAARLRAAGLAAATPEAGRKKASRRRGRTNPIAGSVWLSGLGHSFQGPPQVRPSSIAPGGTSGNAVVVRRQARAMLTRDAQSSALDPQAFVAPLSDLHDNAVEALEG